MNNLSRSEQLAKISKDLMLREPFYGMFLIMLNKKWDNNVVPTAGVGKNGIGYQLYLNEDFWDKLADNQRRGLIKHELLHIGFFHITDFDHLSNKEVANLAEDIEINQYISVSDLPLNPLLPESFPELKLEKKRGTNYYYEKLMQGAKTGNCPNLNAMMAASGAGESTCIIVVRGKGDQEIDLPNHDTWEEFDALSEAEKKLINSQTKHILKEVADSVTKSRGTIPGEFADILNNINKEEPPKFDWKRYLRRFSGGSTKIYTKKIRRKYNKRFEDNPGLKIKPKRHVLVAVDTSGSVSKDELVEFFHEVHHIHKGGTEVTVLQCDAAISNIAPYKKGCEDKIKIYGRGGTSFQPIIDHANKNCHKYTCLIVFTDGEAPAPEKCRIKTLWVHSSKSNINEDLLGLRIKLN